MSFFHKKPSFLKVIGESLLMIIGAVLIWRSIWILLDRFDNLFFGGSHIWSSIFGVVIGVALVFLADRELKDVV